MVGSPPESWRLTSPTASYRAVSDRVKSPAGGSAAPEVALGDDSAKQTGQLRSQRGVTSRTAVQVC